MRLCFLLLSAPYEPWSTLEKNCAMSTWLKDLESRHSAFIYTGTAMCPIRHKIQNRFLKSRHTNLFWRKRILPLPNARFTGLRQISVEIDDSWDTMTRKFLSAASLVKEVLDFDFLIKINTTSYVNVSRLESELLTFLGSTYWGGAVEKSKPFSSGWATVLSRKTLERILNTIENSSESVSSKKFEDEAIGGILRLIGEQLQEIKYLNFTGNEDLKLFDLDKFPFIRIKSTKDRLKNDPRYFESVHKAIMYG